MATEVESGRAGAERPVAQPTLSVTCMTGGPGPRVAALLRVLRPVADEIVVALDDRADGETEAALAAVADGLVRYHYREPVDRPYRWLRTLCSGGWWLNLDDDEVPSAELLELLPELVRAQDVTHYWIRRPWLWPDQATAIAEHPWADDYHLRLVVNDERVLRFPSETHRPIEAIGPHRFVRAPLYHLDAILNSRERREAKARRYEALRPGKRVGGGPMNHVLHLPERRPELLTEPLPQADAELVRTVLEAPPPAAATAERAPVAPDEQIDALWAGRAVERRARLSWVDEPRRLRAYEQRAIDVRVENLSGTTWPWGEHGEPEVRVSYRWDDGAEGIRTALTADLPPGEAQVVPVHVVAPPEPGRRRLRLDLVHEHVAWFGCELDAEVEVERRLRLAVLGPAEAVLERLPDEAPDVEPLVLRPAWEPPPRYGPATAPDLRHYLLDGTVHGRRRDLALIGARAAELLRAARALRQGGEVRPLLRGGQEFLDELAASTHLLVTAAEPGARERLLRQTAVAAARVLGVRTIGDLRELA